MKGEELLVRTVWPGDRLNYFSLAIDARGPGEQYERIQDHELC